MNKQFAGLMGHYGPSLSEKYNKKVIKVNKLVDEYNNTVYSLKGYDAQFKYQKKMFDKINKIIKS